MYFSENKLTKLIIFVYLCRMKLKNIFEEAKSYKGEEITKFYEELVDCIKDGKTFKGFTKEEVQKHLTKPECDCKSKLNCICGEDAE